MSYFIFDNKKIYYEEKGEGTPLLILHGNTGSSNMFAGFVDRYSSDFNVVLIDFLGHGRSDRLSEFPTDLWFYEAQQVISFLREKDYKNVFLIGSSGGAIVAINVALEAPELVRRVIADSFAGERSGQKFIEILLADRKNAKNNPGAKGFFEYMHGPDWEQIVDNDTSAIVRHGNEIADFFHKPLTELKADILLTGSKEDKTMYSISDEYYEKVFGSILQKVPNGRMHLFEHGDHPAMLSDFDEFYGLSCDFLRK